LTAARYFSLHLGKKIDFRCALEICLLVYQDKWFVSASNWNSRVLWLNIWFGLNFLPFSAQSSEIFVTEIVVSMKEPFSQKVHFAYFRMRYAKLLCCKCSVRVLCKEYHVIVSAKQNLLVSVTKLIVWIIFLVRFLNNGNSISDIVFKRKWNF